MFGLRKPGWIARALAFFAEARDASGKRARALRVAPAWPGRCIGAALMLALAGGTWAAEPVKGAAASTQGASDNTSEDERYPASSYFSVTPQLRPLQPFAHLPAGAPATIRAAVATAPDPLETRLGRSFDMEVSALIAAFQARGYVLDGFALPWRPRDAALAPVVASGPDRKPSTARTDAKPPYSIHRDAPGLMLFRKDGWRDGGAVNYYAVFLVGDSQTFGVEPAAFAKAAHCALLFNDIDRATLTKVRTTDCDIAASVDTRREGDLDIIGPSFSGSMQSMAAALGNLCNGPCDERVEITMLSPSASVASNDRIVQHPFLSRRDGARSAMHYQSLALNLTGQIERLLNHLCTKERLNVDNVTILAEESTFGGEALSMAKGDPSRIGCGKELRISARPFPPNIASIRAEHASQRGAQRDKAEAALPVSGRLLELDMSGAEVALERPTVYQPSLSSRSDELMLYRNFDGMKVYTRPDVVVIVATDIRDRLFLLGEVRKAVPRALPVMVELDFLAVHPDYRKASRGAVVLASGDPVVCLDNEGRLRECLDNPPQDERCAKPRDTGTNKDKEKEQEKKKDPLASSQPSSRKARFSFATDHAANTFRAVVLLDEYRSLGGQFNTFMKSKKPALVDVSDGYVATMAGFQGLGAVSQQRRSLIAAADVRLAMQEPTYLVLMLGGLFFVVAALWLWRGKLRGRVVLPLTRSLVQDSRSVVSLLWRRLRHARRPEPPCQPNAAAVASLRPACRRVWLAAMAAAGATTFVIAAVRTIELVRSSDASKQPCYFMLAHGRDMNALTCVWLLYVALCTVAYMRLNVVNRRYAFYNGIFTRNARRMANGTRVTTGISWLVPVACGLAAMYLVRSVHGMAMSIDGNEIWYVGAIVLATGLAFVVNLFWQMRLLGNLSLSLVRTIAPVQTQRGIADWPKPTAIREPPQTPFNLTLREHRRDMPALLRTSPRVWAKRTLQVMANGATAGPETMNPWQFERWTEQLVAELKLCVVAIRTCAWCAMLAPVSVLIAMSMYPPVYERVLTSIAIMLLLAGFGATILVVLRLEKDPMLGLMFTNDGNTLTFGGALRALWPKFVAMGLILVPLAAPDVWSWMYGLVRSINSFG